MFEIDQLNLTTILTPNLHLSSIFGRTLYRQEYLPIFYTKDHTRLEFEMLEGPFAAVILTYSGQIQNIATC